MVFFQKLIESLAGLGARRLALLAATGSVVAFLIFFSVQNLQAPVRTTLYSGLTKADVSEIGAALSDVGMGFDVNEAGDTVLVEFGRLAEARMLLAERGLPRSDKSGYELFDRMGSLGLTSFMQQVTKLRVLEGELVRTIQQLQGVKSARVHLAMKSEGILRNKDTRPTASVVIRLDGTPQEQLAATIRHIVAAAIPGLTADQVTISTTDGKLLGGPASPDESGSATLLDLEKRVSAAAEQRVLNTLEPFAGAENLRVSVSTTINLDKRQTNETRFDPDSKVERSSSVTKSLDSSEDGVAAGPVSVDQNIPREVKPQAPAGSTTKKKEDKQETVNYEVDSTQTATTSAGYIITRMSVAVVVNRKSIVAGLPSGSDEKAIAARLAEIEELARSAAGYEASRKDEVKVSLVDFYLGDAADVVATSPGMMDLVVGNLGTLINALSLIIAIIVVLLLGLRPALRLLLAEAERNPAAVAPLAATEQQVLGAPVEVKPDATETAEMRVTSREQLDTLVNVDVDRAAHVLKKWLNEPERSAA
jgi:flagellar M-ring protein FliF